MENAPETEHLSRPQAIERIRGALLARAGEEECACTIAARADVFCHGFRDLDDKQFRKKFDWIAAKRPQATRSSWSTWCPSITWAARTYAVPRSAVTSRLESTAPATVGTASTTARSRSSASS
jgi:hypothetical protein